MESVFGWLGQISDALLSLFPRRVIVRATHEGVRFRRGRKVVPLYPGVNWYWPLFTEVELYPVKRQTAHLAEQTLTTKDGVAVGISGIVVYRVNRCEDFLVETYDGEDTIRDLALTAIAEVVTQCEYADLHEDFIDLGRKITDGLRPAVQPFGIGIVKTSFSDFFRLDAMIGMWRPGRRGGVPEEEE